VGSTFLHGHHVRSKVLEQALDSLLKHYPYFLGCEKLQTNYRNGSMKKLEIVSFTLDSIIAPLNFIMLAVEKQV
jgi:hypothetical protein